ncbi:MAG: glycosyltransferase [Armatimonadetes bacterium]|nr:glycosyltransferase [Armatimonadota bacterium]
MKILFLTQLFPYPPVCGGTIRSYNLLRHLGACHDVTLVSFVRKEPTKEEMEAISFLCSEIRTVTIRRSAAANLKFAALSLLSGRPFIILRDRVPAMQSIVDDLAQTGEFDLVYVDHLQMAQYVTGLDSCPKILDEHNVEWKIIERVGENERLSPKGLFALVESRKLRKWELEACESFDCVLTVTENDRRTLAEWNKNIKNIHCVPIGVDFDSFRKVDLRPVSRDIVSIATMSWPPNIDSILYFAREIYPLIKSRVDGVRLVVAGSNPPDEIRRLSKTDGSIEVTGFVEDIYQVANRAAAFIVPLRSGSGLRVKILNAMAMGLPIVSTSVGCEGIGAEDGRHLLVTDGAREFADAVVRLITDFDLRRRLGENGMEFAVRNYSWDSIYRKLDQALEMVGEHREGKRRVPVVSGHPCPDTELTIGDGFRDRGVPK